MEGEEVLLRKDAVLKGIKSYFTGKPCLRGHISRRSTDSGSCRECRRLLLSSWREGTREVVPFKTKETPTKDYLCSRFHYNEYEGILFWKEREREDFSDLKYHKSWNTRYSGNPAGSLHYANNYIEIRLDGKLYKAHRLVWKMVHGYDSLLMLDHINGITFDNRVDNLREATPQDNARNARGRNKYKGVVEEDRGFRGVYCINDKSVHSEIYSTAKEAAKWYDKQVRLLYKDFAYLNFKGSTDDF